MIRLGILIALVASLVCGAAPARAAGGSFTRAQGGPRDYWLYVPAGTPPPAGGPRGGDHAGCSQNNDSDPQLAFGTRWNELAAKVGAVVLYPLEAPYDMEHPERVEGNGASCWNWFLEKNNMDIKSKDGKKEVNDQQA